MCRRLIIITNINSDYYQWADISLSNGKAIFRVKNVNPSYLHGLRFKIFHISDVNHVKLKWSHKLPHSTADVHGRCMLVKWPQVGPLVVTYVQTFSSGSSVQPFIQLYSTCSESQALWGPVSVCVPDIHHLWQAGQRFYSTEMQRKVTPTQATAHTLPGSTPHSVCYRDLCLYTTWPFCFFFGVQIGEDLLSQRHLLQQVEKH